MELKDVVRRISSGTVREEAVFESRRGRRYEVYYAAPETLPPPVHRNHFFLIGVMQAYLLGEPYRQAAPVDPVFLRNVRSVLKQWGQWLKRPPIDIDAPEVDALPSHGAAGGGAFFSAGVDSLFTELALGGGLSHLISVEHKENDPLAIADGFSRLSELAPYVDRTGRKHLTVVTNMMIAMPEIQNAYTFLAHGGALASVAHFLSGELSRATVSSSHTFGALEVWGSHPLTDSLFSSAGLDIFHFGAQYTRVEKTARIARSKEALNILSVCKHGRLNCAQVNCSRCEKCLRTMLTLDLAGVDRKEAVTFDWSAYDPQEFSKLFLRGDSDIAIEIRDAARLAGRRDIADATEKAIRRSLLFNVLYSMEMRVRRRWPHISNSKKNLLRFRGAVYSGLGLTPTLAYGKPPPAPAARPEEATPSADL